MYAIHIFRGNHQDYNIYCLLSQSNVESPTGQTSGHHLMSWQIDFDEIHDSRGFKVISKQKIKEENDNTRTVYTLPRAY